jgi:hypothetical protein
MLKLLVPTLCLGYPRCPGFTGLWLLHVYLAPTVLELQSLSYWFLLSPSLGHYPNTVHTAQHLLNTFPLHALI